MNISSGQAPPNNSPASTSAKRRVDRAEERPDAGSMGGMGRSTYLVLPVATGCKSHMSNSFISPAPGVTNFCSPGRVASTVSTCSLRAMDYPGTRQVQPTPATGAAVVTVG